MPPRNDRSKGSASDDEAVSNALDLFLPDPVRRFPSAVPPKERPSAPSLAGLPGLPGLSNTLEGADTVQTRGAFEARRLAPAPESASSAPGSVSNTASVEHVDGVDTVGTPPPIVPRRPRSDRAVARPRTDRTAHARIALTEIGWQRIAIGVLVIVGVAEVAVIGWRVFGSRPTVAVGTMTVTSKPAGAQLLVDGEMLGVTPATLRTPEGVHALEIRSAGPTQIMAVRVGKDGQVSRFFDLPVGTAAASLRIETKPSGARVLVDGRPRGRSPMTVTGLNPGPHAVRVERGAQFLGRDVMLESGAYGSLNLELDTLSGDPSEGHGWLAVSMPIALQAYEQGRLVGTSRAGPWQLAAGRHEIEFLNPLLDVRLNRTVEVVAGKTTSLDLAVPSGLVSISSTAWAEIQIDGETIGVAPIVDRALPAGQHDIVARHTELGERRLSVTIPAGTAVSVRVDFRR
jgi:PEGA domain